MYQNFLKVSGQFDFNIDVCQIVELQKITDTRGNSRESDLDYLSELSGTAIRQIRTDYVKFLPHNVVVTR